MARFDVYANPYPPERSHTPCVLDIQNDHLGPLATRVVIPCRTPEHFGGALKTLNPTLDISGRQLILDTAALAPVQARLLTRCVTQIDQQRELVLEALDTLFGSF